VLAAIGPPERAPGQLGEQGCVTGPARFDWTQHARAKASREAWVPADVGHAIVEHHARRRRNPDPDKADWLLPRGRLVVAYNWPWRTIPCARAS
jgi:hypothetical protein